MNPEFHKPHTGSFLELTLTFSSAPHKALGGGAFKSEESIVDTPLWPGPFYRCLNMTTHGPISRGEIDLEMFEFEVKASKELLQPLEPPRGPISATLEHAYGQTGAATNRAILLTASGNLIWPVGSAAVVCAPSTQRKKTFRGHDAPIVSLCISPLDRTTVATGDEEGQIAIWDGDTQKIRKSLRASSGDPIRALRFGPSGSRLASLIGNGEGTLRVWDWRKQRLYTREADTVRLSCTPVKGVPGGDPPLEVCDLAWGDDKRIVTVGVRHCVSWRVSRTDGLVPSKVRWGHLHYSRSEEEGICTSFLTVEAFRGGYICGGYDGSLHFMTGDRLLRRLSAHWGPCISLHVHRDWVISGGKGEMIIWDLSLQEVRRIRLQEEETLSGLCIRREEKHEDEGGSHEMIVISRHATPLMIGGVREIPFDTGSGISERSLCDGLAGPSCHRLLSNLNLGVDEAVRYRLAAHPTKPYVACVSPSFLIMVFHLKTRSAIQTWNSVNGSELPRGLKCLTCRWSAEHLHLLDNTGGIWKLRWDKNQGEHGGFEPDAEETKDSLPKTDNVNEEALVTIGAFSPDFTQVAMVRNGAPLCIRLRDNALSTLDPPEFIGDITRMDWSNDDTMVRACNNQLATCTWNTYTGKKVTDHTSDWNVDAMPVSKDLAGVLRRASPSLEDEEGIKSLQEVESLCCMPDQSILISGGRDGTLQLYDYPCPYVKENPRLPLLVEEGHGDRRAVQDLLLANGIDKKGSNTQTLVTVAADGVVLQWRLHRP